MTYSTAIFKFTEKSISDIKTSPNRINASAVETVSMQNTLPLREKA